MKGAADAMPAAIDFDAFPGSGPGTLDSGGPRVRNIEDYCR